MTEKIIPVGKEDFSKIILNDNYYVDKTELIKELIDTNAGVVLFTRPRRFGKTMNQSMLKYFFEKTDTDTASLFKDLKISGYDGKYMKYQGKYPVISVTFKSIHRKTFEDSLFEFKTIISNEFKRHISILNSEALLESEKKMITAIIDDKAKVNDFISGLSFLSGCLKKVYDQDVIVLIDEYDVPLECAFFNGFYTEMVDLIRSCFEKVLKTNPDLHMAVLTGCLRISKESIFTGLNNLTVYDVTDEQFSTCFGFTVDEVKSMLAYYGETALYDTIKDWYDGYLFGITEIYNPYSVTSAVNKAIHSTRFVPEAFWPNTSSNNIVKDLAVKCDDETRLKLEQLMTNFSLEEPIHKDLTYGDLETVNSEQIWSHLLFTGYLKQRYNPDTGNYILQIPNREIRIAYDKVIKEAFNLRVRTTPRDDLLRAIIQGDEKTVEIFFKKWIYKSISYYDTKEDFYHGVMLGLLSGIEGYTVKSNRESGDGRFDLILYDAMTQSVGIIFEFKFAKTQSQLSSKCEEALQQIEKLNYKSEFSDLGIDHIIKYGLAFFKKTCKVKLGK